MQTQVSHFNFTVYVYPNSENDGIKKDAWNLTYIPLSQKVLHTHFLEDSVNYIPYVFFTCSNFQPSDIVETI